MAPSDPVLPSEPEAGQPGPLPSPDAHFVDLTATPADEPVRSPVVAPPPHIVDMTDTPVDPEKVVVPTPEPGVPEPGRWREEGVTGTRRPASDDDTGDPYLNPELMAQLPGTAQLFPRSRGGWLGLVAKVVIVAALCYVPLAVHGVCWVSLLFSLLVLAGALAVLRVRRLPALVTWMVVAVVAFGLLELWNGTAFDTLALTGAPPAVQWCGVHYDKVGTAARPPHLQTVGTSPSGMAILSATGCDAGASIPPRVYGDRSSTSVYVYRFGTKAAPPAG